MFLRGSKQSKIQRVADLVVIVDGLKAGTRFINSLSSHQDRVDCLAILRAKLQGRDTEQLEEAFFNRPGIINDSEACDKIDLDADHEAYKSAIRNLSTDKQSELGLVLLKFLSNSPTSGLLECFGDDAMMLVKGKVKRNSAPRKWAPELVIEAHELRSVLRTRIRAIKKFYHQVKKSSAWPKLVDVEAKKQRRKPNMPKSIIMDLPFKSPDELALEWAAEELARKHPQLDFTVGGLKKIFKKKKPLLSSGYQSGEVAEVESDKLN